MVDIVNRLREVAEIETGLLYSRRQMLKDAADEITSLRSERDAAEAMCDEMAKAIEEAKFALFSGDMTIKDRADQSMRVALDAYRKAQEVGK
jgi:hypothetical protein